MKYLISKSLVLLIFIIMVKGAYGYGQFDANLDGQASGWEVLPIEVIVDGGTLFGQNVAFNLVQQAVNIWNNSLESLILLQSPTQSTTDFDENNQLVWGVNDGKIRVIFDEGGLILSSAGMDPTGGILGIGLTNSGANGKAISGVLVINGHSTASTNGDLLGVITHEFGHVLGLTHTPVGFGGISAPASNSIPTMYPFSVGGASTLEADDVSGIRAIYEP